MPGISGLETCEKMGLYYQQKKKSPPPMIFFTGSDNLQDRMKGFELGATDFLKKEFGPGELLSGVNKLLRSESRFAHCTALVIDDSMVSRRIIRENLKSLGMTVITSKDGEEGFRAYQKHEHDLDIVITDYSMPNLSGIELTTKIRKECGNRDIPIIMLTGNTNRKDIIEYFNAGATDYLFKPFIKEEFIARVYSQIDTFNVKKSLKGNISELRKLNTLKDHFLSICSHDLKSPLTGIIGYIALLLRKKDRTPKELEQMESIRDAANFLLQLINNLLDLGKIGFNEDMHFREVDLNQLIVEILNIMQGSARIKKIQLYVKNHIKDPILLYGDGMALKRVFNNLLSNAIKFTPSKGNIHIEIDTFEESMIEVKVKDDGVGIPSDKIGNIFQKFTKSSTSGTAGEAGTGLGLSIVKSIVEKHNGKIKVESKKDQGSCFSVYLPVKG